MVREAMDDIVRRLTGMFSKIMAGTVTREEGAILINHLVRENSEATRKALSYLIENPPRNVFQKTVLHTIALSRNRAFLEILARGLKSDNEDVSILAASELARLRTPEAMKTLREGLSSEMYHVRKASAAALAEYFGDEGVEILKEHILNHEEPFFRATSAHALAFSGDRGMKALFSILVSEKPGPVHTAAEAIVISEAELPEEGLPVAVDALMRAGDRRDVPCIVELLKVIACFGKRAARYRTFVEVFVDDPSESVRGQARRTLESIGEA